MHQLMSSCVSHLLFDHYSRLAILAKHSHLSSDNLLFVLVCSEGCKLKPIRCHLWMIILVIIIIITLLIIRLLTVLLELFLIILIIFIDFVVTVCFWASFVAYVIVFIAILSFVFLQLTIHVILQFGWLAFSVLHSLTLPVRFHECLGLDGGLSNWARLFCIHNFDCLYLVEKLWSYLVIRLVSQWFAGHTATDRS